MKCSYCNITFLFQDCKFFMLMIIYCSVNDFNLNVLKYVSLVLLIMKVLLITKYFHFCNYLIFV